jgi:O-antigen ligase
MLLSYKNMKNNSRSKITNQGTLCAFLLAASLFGVQIVMVIPIFLSESTTPFSIVFRLICLFVSVYLIFKELFKLKAARIQFATVIALIFWITYTVRLIYDLEIAEVHLHSLIYQNKKAMIYQFELGATLVPIIALMFNVKYINVRQLVSFYYWAALLNTLSIIYITIKLTGSISMEMFATRQAFSVGVEENSVFGTPINPIVVSISGASLFILSLSILLFLVKNKTYAIPKMNKKLLIFTIILGIITLFLGSSRGPLLSGILTSLLVIIFYLRSVKFSAKYTLITSGILVGLFFSIAYYIDSNNITLSMLDRIQKTADDQTTGQEEHRDILFRTAINQFVENPLFGDQIFEKFDYSYPHNIIMEAFMATGIVGGIPLLIMIFIVLNRGLKLFINIPSLLSVVYFITFFQLGMSLTSGNIFSAPEMWIPFSFTLFSAAVSTQKTEVVNYT